MSLEQGGTIYWTITQSEDGLRSRLSTLYGQEFTIETDAQTGAARVRDEATGVVREIKPDTITSPRAGIAHQDAAVPPEDTGGNALFEPQCLPSNPSCNSLDDDFWNEFTRLDWASSTWWNSLSFGDQERERQRRKEECMANCESAEFTMVIILCAIAAAVDPPGGAACIIGIELLKRMCRAKCERI